MEAMMNEFLKGAALVAATLAMTACAGYQHGDGDGDRYYAPSSGYHSSNYNDDARSRANAERVTRTPDRIEGNGMSPAVQGPTS
jgi:hypothetical protein